MILLENGGLYFSFCVSLELNGQNLKNIFLAFKKVQINETDLEKSGPRE